MKVNDLVKEEMHKVFKTGIFKENKAYKLVNEENGRELFVGILILWLPGEVKFVVPSNSYIATNYSSLVEKHIDNSLAIISFSPGFLKDNYTLELLG